MAASTSPFRVATSLRLGERVLTRCDDGVLLAEYALFDVADIVLRATDPVTVREVGYMTTAGEALERLERAGITPELVQLSAQALSGEVAASYARGTTAQTLVPKLDAHELFDGAIFSASAQKYEGAWLDLRTLAGALAVPMASASMQALHLHAALTEVSQATPLHLATAAATRNRRPGERTHQRVAFEYVAMLPGGLRALRPLARPPEIEPARDRLLRRALVARVRERSSADAKPEQRSHLSSLEEALSVETMPLGPLTDPQLRAIERRLAGGQLEGVEEELAELEQASGNAPGVRYLRARATLLRGDAPPRSVAQALSQLVEENQGFHEAALVAARTWLAVGEDAHARYFARRLFDDPSAGDSERLVALEILEATTATDHSYAPPPVSAQGTMPYLAPPRVPAFNPLAHLPPPRAFPPDGASMRPAPNPFAPGPGVPFEAPAPVTQRSPPPPLPNPPRALGPSSAPPPPTVRTATARTTVTMATPAEAMRTQPVRSRMPSRPPESPLPPRPSSSRPPPSEPWRSGSSRPPPPGPARSSSSHPPPAEPARRSSSRPPPQEPARSTGSTPRPPPMGRARYEPELVETLPLPAGATESALGLDELPRTPLQARIALTRLSRDLARDYRLAYGKTLRCNVLAIDAMQQHLMHRFAGATLSDHGVTWELRRHGALVSEVLARVLGGYWTDVGPSEPGYWAMTLAPSLVTFPIGRVYRFVALGSRERDLVGYYLEIDARLRSLE